MSRLPGSVTRENKKATLKRGLLRIQLDRDAGGSGLRFPGPVTQLEVLFDLPAFVSIFLGFIRTVGELPEGMFGIADDFSNNFQ